MARLARFQRTIVDDAGNVMPGAAVEVRNEETGLLAQLYSDRAGLVGVANPIAAAAITGFCAFYIIGGAYKLTATLGDDEIIWRHEGIGTASEYDANNLLFAFPIFFQASDKPGASEALPQFDVFTALTLPADLPGSIASVRIPAAIEQVISIVRASAPGEVAVEIATATFASGAFTATFQLAADVELLIGQQIWPVMPDPRDTLMADFAMVIVALR